MSSSTNHSSPSEKGLDYRVIFFFVFTVPCTDFVLEVVDADDWNVATTAVLEIR